MTTTPFVGLEDKQADRNRISLPTGGQLAAMIRDGATVADLMDLYGASKTIVYTRIRDSGYGPDGQVRKQQMAARPAEAPFLQQSEPWLTQRACAEADPDVFHDNRQTDLAKTICGECRVATQCLEYALRVEDASAGRYGVYGGLTGDERARLVKNK